MGLQPVGREWLFTAQTTNATSPSVLLNYPTGHGIVTAWGTWDGASINLYTVLADTTQIPVTDPSGDTITFTANSQYPISYFVVGEQLIGILSNAGGSTSINLTVNETASGL